MNEFSHKITFEKETEVPDGSGGYVENWITFKEADALVQPITGDSYFIAKQNQSKIKYKVFVEFDEEITDRLRIKYGNEIITIDVVIDQGGQNEILVLMCESGNV